MLDTVKHDIIVTLKEVIRVLKKKDPADLEDISDHTIHNASIFQDEDSVSVAVLIYSLYKLGVQERLGDYDRLIRIMYNAIDNLNKNKFGAYSDDIRDAFKVIHKADSKLKFYIQEVINKSHIKKGSRIVDHGISLARAAQIMGVSQWELMTYVGKTKIMDSEDVKKSLVRRRLNFARSVFK